MTDAQAIAPAYDRDTLRAQMERLRREAATRAQLENEIATEFERTTKAAAQEAAAARTATQKRYADQIAAARGEHETIKRKTAEAVQAERKKLDDDLSSKRNGLQRECAQLELQAKEDESFDESSSREVHKERRKEPDKHFQKGERDLAKMLQTVGEAESKAASIATQRAVPEGVGGELPTGANPLAEIDALQRLAVESVTAMAASTAAKRAFSGGTTAAAIALPVLAAAVVGAGAFFALPQALKLIAAAGAGGGIAVAGIVVGIVLVGRLKTAARKELAGLRGTVIAAAARARGLEPACREALAARKSADAARIEEEIRREVDDRKRAFEAKMAGYKAARDKKFSEFAGRHAAAVEKLEAKAREHLTAADAKYPPRIATLEQEQAEKLAAIDRERETREADATARRTQRWEAMTAAWREARESTAAVYDEASRIDAACFRPWNDLADEAVALPSEPPPGLRFGSLGMSLERVAGGVSADEALNAFGPVSWRQPATVPYPDHASLVIKTTPDQRETAAAFMQALTLRIATGIPAGQSRFTIIDPLGLGKQFAGFMHLADHDELLVNSRIWTEPPLIEQRLADITEQMEVVIQKYLRNEYPSIGAYNADAEVPEPYRFVVVANFPANFNETSARRLASIASSGARCGVYLIVSVDTTQRMPSGFSLAELEQQATTLVLKDGTFTWNDTEFSKWPLAVEEAPADETFTKIVQRVGRAAKAAKRIEVPFDRVAPKEEEWWTQSTSSEVLAPLGPAGAKKLQYLRLGKGTSQHVLIAGKTGSGKSTLMHAMITSLSLQYSPNEIQFYLIDFKKGVEFKLYDHYKLPHARVIAIESEREFGLSVLEQLDRELKRRGDLFRDLAVQDVAGFRQTGTPDPMPRILLVIDEFQEIFVEDDKIAQDASLILDRLVRQGRAFGMHVLLGSQTLGGSYSLPRATMGQMAVRIALQCNEADSSLILSDDNTAARLLTRPGEAIYNDANGMVAGNNPFQVVFLNDERRERYLGSLRALADRRTDIPQVPKIVFDGNQAADPAGNPLLSELLASGTVQGREPVAPLAWLGDAIAIKDPTAAIFRRQGGANMLVIGQREDLGTSLLAMSLVSLAAGHDPHPGGGLGRAARFVVFEPAIADERPDLLLSKMVRPLPHEVEVVGRLSIATAVEELAAEVKRRIDNQIIDAEAVFVVIRDLGRFRELRKADGDFGFSFGGDQKAGPAQNLITVLKDGPTVGVHTVIWCDSLTNLQRTFDRGALKEFELRVLFQMSSSDSSQLIDSPAASKLGPQRALFIHEETGTLEKFRPYAFPTPDWVETVAATMRKRPLGTPVDRPRSAAAAPQADAPAAAGDGGFSFSGFGGDFNFTKMIDEIPGVGDDEEPPADAGA